MAISALACFLALKTTRTQICVRGIHVGVHYKDGRGVLRQTGNYMQDSTGWRGWGRGQKSLVGWVCTGAAYCRNVNPPIM